MNKGHGRIETRECWVITAPDCLDYLGTRKQWAGLKAVVKVNARRETADGATVQSRYYISSLKAPAERCWRRCANIEASRIHCTGVWT